MLPSVDRVFEFTSVDEFSTLLGNAELDAATAQWWIGIISASSSRLMLAATGYDETLPIEWAQVILPILEAASSARVLNPLELLYRRIFVQISALHAGYQILGEPAEICVGVFEELTRLGESRDLISKELRKVSNSGELLGSRLVDLQKIRSIMRKCSSIRDLVPPGAIRSELDLWLAALLQQE